MPRSFPARIATTMVLAGPLIALAPVAASAHAHLKSATPAAGATVSTPPSEVTIDFTEGVEPLFCKIEVLDALGVHVEEGPPDAAPGDNKHLTEKLKRLGAGTYTVQWHATAVDTHKTEGSYDFTVAQGAGR